MTRDPSESSKRDESMSTFGRQCRRTFLRTAGTVVALGGSSTVAAGSDTGKGFDQRYGQFGYGKTQN
ncbi:hypothetical protein C2R22_08945 [Salinigranum rubrum]|uniref:Uncharacterized protein n=2 Tax=Salinigranum rubrum TaxID=755307 RepID=A0A2I8VKZ8_9EURY|nr:hypothetical protein C2R22_08945 [Salinigranum rubrum]